MIYFITNRKLVEPENFLPIIEEAAVAGVGTIILREKDLNYTDFLKLGLKVKAITSQLGVPRKAEVLEIPEVPGDQGKPGVSIIINGNIQVAREIKADGVQMGFKDFMKKRPDFPGLVGVSVHSLEEAQLAEQKGADYLLASHIFPTDCKKGLVPRGISWLKEVTSRIDIPVVALGGIKLENIKSVFEAQASGAALMSEIMCAPDVAGLITDLKSEISN